MRRAFLLTVLVVVPMVVMPMAVEATTESTTTSTESTTTTTTTIATEPTTTTTSTEPLPETTSTTMEPTTTTSTTTSTTIAVRPPSVPRELTAAPAGSGQVKLTWLPPLSDGGAPITDYKVQRYAGPYLWVLLEDDTSTATSYIVSGLQRGVPYFFVVSATNVAGDSPRTKVVRAYARFEPSAPRSLTAAPTGRSGQIRLTWRPPVDPQWLDDYIIQRWITGIGWRTINDGVNTATAYIVTGLTTGVSYDFRVLARDYLGNSPPSNTASAVPLIVAVPSAPRSLTVSPGASGQLRLSWLAPLFNGGFAVTDYIIQRWTPSGWTPVYDGRSTATTITLNGLVNGEAVTFRVFARNLGGVGAPSNLATGVPRTIPSAPRLRAYPGSARVLLMWSRPANGGSVILRFVIQRATSPTGVWSSVSANVPPSSTSLEVTGLVNGRRYYFRIRAVNAAGAGPWSTVSVVPAALAGSGYYFANCTDVNLAGAAPLLRTQAGYRTGLDRDNDGIACLSGNDY